MTGKARMKNTAPPSMAGVRNKRLLLRALRIMPAVAHRGSPDQSSRTARLWQKLWNDPSVAGVS
jgi:hypothetical protein